MEIKFDDLYIINENTIIVKAPFKIRDEISIDSEKTIETYYYFNVGDYVQFSNKVKVGVYGVFIDLYSSNKKNKTFEEKNVLIDPYCQYFITKLDNRVSSLRNLL